MLTGKPPFSGDSPVAVSYMHIHDLPRPITQNTPDVPPAIADTVAKALLKKQEERYQTAEEFRNAIALARSALREAPTAGTSAPETSAPEPHGAKATALRTEAIESGTGGMQPRTMIFSPGSAGKGRRILVSVVGAAVLVAGAVFGMQLLKGSGSTEVPQLAQMPLARAEEVLREAGLKWRTLDQESGEYAPGSVMGQAPAAGALVAEGTEMVLTIAKEPSVARVPDVIGVVSLAAAEDRLNAEGVQIGTVTEQTTSDFHEGTVIAQDPAGGTIANSDTKVNLVVAAAK